MLGLVNKRLNLKTNILDLFPNKYTECGSLCIGFFQTQPRKHHEAVRCLMWFTVTVLEGEDF